MELLLSAYFLIAFAFCVWTSRGMQYTFCPTDKKGAAWLVCLYIAAALLPFLIMCFVPLPLPLFYLFLYGMSCLPIFGAKKQKKQLILFLNVRFLVFTAPHLVVIGILALCAGTDVLSVLQNDTLRLVSLGIVTTLDAVANPLLSHRLSGGELRFLKFDSEEIPLFSKFLWFCVCSVVLDSVPCLFPLPTAFSTLFLIGSNLLLLLMAFLFASHVYGIMRDAHLKEESIRLQEEAIAQHSLTVRLEREAYLDVLTRTYTRAYALTSMTNMLKSDESFVLAFIDLDGLKQINDQHGHLAGDRYLQRFSAYMKLNLRHNDMIARYGGDEFLVLMPDCTIAAAHQRFAQLQGNAAGEFPFSYGLVLAAPGENQTPEEWIAAADRVMYQDKKCRRACKERE